jgi:hypothetical protein
MGGVRHAESTVAVERHTGEEAIQSFGRMPKASDGFWQGGSSGNTPLHPMLGSPMRTLTPKPNTDPLRISVSCHPTNLGPRIH